MPHTTIQLRTDSKLKKQAAEILAKLGLDLSSGITIYLKQIVQYRGIPFLVRTVNGFTPEQEQQMIKEFEESKKGKTYPTAKALFDDILRRP